MEGLELARRLLHQAGEAYRDADDLTQRAWNQTFFTKLFVAPTDEEGPAVVSADLSEPFAQLLSDDLAASVDSALRSETPVSAGGSTVDQIVETVGIEPTSAIALQRLLRA